MTQAILLLQAFYGASGSPLKLAATDCNVYWFIGELVREGRPSGFNKTTV